MRYGARRLELISWMAWVDWKPVSIANPARYGLHRLPQPVAPRRPSAGKAEAVITFLAVFESKPKHTHLFEGVLGVLRVVSIFVALRGRHMRCPNECC